MIRTLREAPEVCSGDCRHVDVAAPPSVLVHRADHDTGVMLFLHNLGDEDVTVDVGSLEKEAEYPNDVLADRDYGETHLSELALSAYGYRWIRLRRHTTDGAPPLT
jgi:maltose alpha-D-glucosyltransferase/alpha-amylase